MKKVILYLFFMLFLLQTKAQYVAIPDTNFRNLLLTYIPTCFNINNELDTSCSDVKNLKKLENIRSGSYYYFRNMFGIEYFTSLDSVNIQGVYFDTSYYLQVPNSVKYLNCGGGFLKHLGRFDYWGSSLIELIIWGNNLETIENFPFNIKVIDVPNNNLKELKGLIYLNQLEKLHCSYNKLTLIDTLNVWTINRLKRFDCDHNNLTSLPDFQPYGLSFLNCSSNNLSSLPTLYINLWELDFSNNPNINLSSTIFPNTLTSLQCNRCNLTYLPAIPNSNYFYRLEVDSNKLTSLPNLPAGLTSLTVSRNLLTSLPTLPSGLGHLRCENNFNLTCLPKLPSNMYTLNINNTKIACLPNKPLNISTALPICKPTFNPNNCAYFPVIQGNAYTDLNNNISWNANEKGKENLKISLQNGTTTFTQKNGAYQFVLDSIGSYTVTISKPNLYNVIPANRNYTLTKNDTIVTDSFALQPNTSKDSLSIKTIPLNTRARPGFSYPYMVVLENVGTTTLNSTLNFIYDNSKIIIDSTNNVAAIIGTNNISLALNNFVPSEINNLIIYCTIKQSTSIGDKINYSATLNGGTANETTTGSVTVTGSFDPNEKHATPELTPQNCADGKDIFYTIYFQNTGNDTAFNVVITDTLSNKVLPNTLQFVGSSHNCKLTQNDNRIFFEFNNILLPDSFVNEKKSHGFVQFKVKPKPTLVNGDIVNNKAHIYFDFNAPIITNTSQTFIRTILPVKFVNFEVALNNQRSAPSPLERAGVRSTWLTASEQNVLKFVIQKSYDNSIYKSVGQVEAKGFANKYEFIDQLATNYFPQIIYYRIQVIDKDGTITYSEVRKVDFNKTKNVNILENPVVNNTLKITCNKVNSQASIVDIYGKVLQQFKITSNNQSINISTLPKGSYLLKVDDEVMKFLK